MPMRMVLLIGLLLFLNPAICQAYLGPGLGAGALAVALGFIGSIFLAIFAIFWYPIKRFVKRIKNRKSTSDQGQ